MAQMFGDGTIKMNYEEVYAKSAEIRQIIDNIKEIFLKMEKEINILQETETFKTDKSSQEILDAAQKAVKGVNDKATNAKLYCSALDLCAQNLKETDTQAAGDYGQIGDVSVSSNNPGTGI